MPSDVAAAQKTVQTADAQLFSWLKFLIGVRFLALWHRLRGKVAQAAPRFALLR
jgi:hypothetical protein